MDVLLRSAPVALIASLVLAAGAQAADHRMHVTEVDPSASDPSMAFVELQDSAGESFPAASYTLASLDGSGVVLGQQVFTPPYGFALNTQPFLVAADGRATRDAALTIPLAAARQVCFYRGTSTATGNIIHCLSFQAPPEGQSAQLTNSEAVIFACPTPDAANRQVAEPCAGGTPPPTNETPPPTNETPPPMETTPPPTTQTPPPTTQTTPPPTGTTPPTTATPPLGTMPDVVAPGLQIAARRAQRFGRVRVSTLLNEQSTITITGAGRAAGQKFAILKIRRVTPAGTRKTFALTLTRAGRASVRRAIGRGSRPRLTMKIVARDAAGNVTTKRLRITLTI